MTRINYLEALFYKTKFLGLIPEVVYEKPCSVASLWCDCEPWYSSASSKVE